MLVATRAFCGQQPTIIVTSAKHTGLVIQAYLIQAKISVDVANTELKW